MANRLQITTHAHSFKLIPQKKVTEIYQNITYFLRDTIPSKDQAHIVNCNYIMTNWSYHVTDMRDSLN